MINTEKAWFVSFPRSGSNWYINLLAAGLGWDHTKIRSKLLFKSHSVKIRHNLVIFYMYRHPKDAFLSFAIFRHNENSLKQWRHDNPGVDRKSSHFMDSFNKEVLRELVLGSGYKGRGVIEVWKSLQDYYTNLSSDLVFRFSYEDVLKEPEKYVREGLRRLGFSSDIKNIESELTSLDPEERLKEHANKYKRNPYWTKGIDKAIDAALGEEIKKYGYGE